MNRVRVGFLTRTLLQNHYRRYYRYEQTFLQGASVHQQGKILALLDSPPSLIWLASLSFNLPTSNYSCNTLHYVEDILIHSRDFHYSSHTKIFIS
jgi:hypothetical protein